MIRMLAEARDAAAFGGKAVQLGLKRPVPTVPAVGETEIHASG